MGTTKKKQQDKYRKKSFHDDTVAVVMGPKLIKVTKTANYFALFLIVTGISSPYHPYIPAFSTIQSRSTQAVCKCKQGKPA